MIVIWLIFFIAVNFSSAEIFNGTCPSFDKCYNPYLNCSRTDLWNGVWFMQEKIGYEFQDKERCSFMNFVSTNETNKKTFMKHEVSGGVWRSNPGTFTFNEKNSFESTYTNLNISFGTYHILNINCKYWVTVTCHECGIFTKEDAGIHGYAFTRDQFPSQRIRDAYIEDIERCGISRTELTKQDQSGCNFC